MPLRLTALLLLATALLGCGTATHPIPTLDTQGDVYKTEGPNDPLIYDDPVGDKSAIIVYADFPDRQANQSTQQRAAKVLGGSDEEGTFQSLFRSNSYGKLSLDLTHVHGWRTMPKGHKAYDPTTTEGHRAMFVDAFELYPEVNFLDYDYILVLMTAKGNFAFGERPDKAIPYRGEKITTAVNQGSQSPYVLAHELAHCMGLPDLYTYTDRVPDDAPRNPLGPWDIMSSAGRASGFIGWHRHKFGWLDDDRKTYLTQGTPTLDLTPLDGDEGLSMIAVPSDNAENPSKVFVIELAQPLRMKDDAPKPGGVLVYSIDATRPSGQNPAVVHPRRDKVNAAYHPGDRFAEDQAPMRVEVLKQTEDGGYRIKVDVTP